MKLSELNATAIVVHCMGERGALKSEEDLQVILKKRLTKKERQVMNVLVQGDDVEAFLPTINATQERFDQIVMAVTKKLKNEGIHREFYILSSKES